MSITSTSLSETSEESILTGTISAHTNNDLLFKHSLQRHRNTNKIRKLSDHGLRISKVLAALSLIVRELGLIRMAMHEFQRFVFKYLTRISSIVWCKILRLFGRVPTGRNPESAGSGADHVDFDEFSDQLAGLRLIHGSQEYDLIPRRISRTCLSCGHTENVEKSMTIPASANINHLLQYSAISAAAFSATYLLWWRRRNIRSWLARTKAIGKISRRRSKRSLRKTSVYI